LSPKEEARTKRSFSGGEGPYPSPSAGGKVDKGHFVKNFSCIVEHFPINLVDKDGPGE